MGFQAKLSVYLVLTGILAGIGLNLVVLNSCEFLNANGKEVRLGVLKYSVNDNTTELNTNGECELYDNLDDEDLEWEIKMARVCAIIAPVCGAVVFLWVGMTQFCCPIPCGGPVLSLAYLGCQLGTAFVWLVRGNEICDTVLGGCEWGDAARCNLAAQVAYILAAFLHRFMPDPKLAAEARRADNAEADLQKERNKTKSQGNHPVPQEIHASPNSGADVERLKRELAQQKQAVSAAENRATAAESRAKTFQVQFNQQAADLEKQRNLLAAATTTTSAAGEAAKIRELKEEVSELEHLLQQKQKKMEEFRIQLAEAQENAKKQREALAAAKAAAATAEAAEIKKLRKRLKKQDEELKRAMEKCEEQEAALAVANGVATATSTTEAMTIQELRKKLDQQTEELEALRNARSTSSKASSENPEVVVFNGVQELKAKYDARIEELEEENMVLKGLAVTGAQSKAAAGALAAEIEKLQQLLKQKEEEYDAKLKELQASKNVLPVFKAGNSGAADPDGTSVAEERQIKSLRAILEQQKEEYETKIKWLEEQVEAQKVALGAITALSGEPLQVRELREVQERQKEELKAIYAGEKLKQAEGNEEDFPRKNDPPRSGRVALDPLTSGESGPVAQKAAEMEGSGNEIDKLEDEIEHQKEEFEDGRDDFLSGAVQ